MPVWPSGYIGSPSKWWRLFCGAPATYSWEATIFHAAAVVAMNRSYSYFVQLLLLLFVSYKMCDTLQLSNAMQRHTTREIHCGTQPSVDKIHYMGFTVVQTNIPGTKKCLLFFIFGTLRSYDPLGRGFFA